MTKSPFFLLPLAALALVGCNFDVNAEDKRLSSDGKSITTKAATTGAFTKIEGVGPDNIVFVTGDAFSIKASGDADTIAKLRYAMDNGTIIIGREKGKWWDDGDGVTITVTAPVLAQASLIGSGDFSADKMTGNKVELEIAGSGNLSVAQLTAKSFESKIAGSGDITLAGTADMAGFEIAGSGSIDAKKLVSANAKVSIAGSGNVDLDATGTVDAKIAGSGNINVTGGAKCKSSTVGSGSVNCG